MGRPLAGFQRHGLGREAHHLVVGVKPALCALARGRQDVARVLRQVARVEGRALAGVEEEPADHVEGPAPVLHGLLGGGAEGRKRHRPGLGAREIRAGAGIGHERVHDARQPPVLAVVEVIGLGGGKQDLFDPAPEEKLGQERVPTGPEGAEDIGHGLAEIVDRGRPGMDRAQGVNEDHLPVDPGEVVAEEGFDDLALVGLEAALELAGEAAPTAACGKGCKGQDRRAREIAR